MNRPSTQIHPTASFDEDLGRLREELGAGVIQVFRDLARAVIKLEKYEWDDSLPIEPFGSSGDTFAYAFSPGFVFTFQIKTDRDEESQPVLIHLLLERIMRA